jgi:GT2 family glycosyltransferase
MHKIVIVTVTYGKRTHLLVQALASAFREGAEKAIVVDNGSQDDIQTILDQTFSDRVKVVPMGSNTGSARGFAEGLKTAFNDGAEFILMLDDDNRVEKQTIDVLYCGWCNNLINNNKADLIMLGFRREHQADVTEGLSPKQINQHPDSFFGFHILDIPFKIWRRTHWFKSKFKQTKIPHSVKMTVAPYSGMFFHRAFLEKHGYPNKDFVLYADDTEFSSRVTQAGGCIWLVTDACISDLESSWNVKKRFKSIFEGFLLGDGEYRVYYSARNQAYFEAHCRKHCKIIRSVNRTAFLCILTVLALKLEEIARLKLLLSAIKDGEASKLGINNNYPLA